MNVKRFTARNSREALRLVREALGDDAIVLSTKPAATGVEVMAMAPDSLGRLEAMATEQAPPALTAEAATARATELGASSAEQDADRAHLPRARDGLRPARGSGRPDRSGPPQRHPIILA